MAAKEGDHSDGGGLILRVRGDSASWVYRFTSPAGRRREMGLGPARRGSADQAGASLTGARDSAHLHRDALRRGLDPIDAREQQREGARAAEAATRERKSRDRWTLAAASRDYHQRVIEPSKSDKHSAQWIASLENHIPAAMWGRPVGDIGAPELLAALQAIKPHERARNLKGDTLAETVQRIRQRLDAIFEDSIFHGRCASNPAAAIKRKLREATGRRRRGEFRALPYKEAPAFMADLRQAEGLAARCLEFTVLTAARTGESLHAEWPEFDLEAGVWIVPPERMKAKESHTVFLPARAVEILLGLRGLHKRLVFPSPMVEEQPLSNMAMLTTLDRLGYRERTTVHGLARATFSTWANETGAARPDVIEACLAHQEANRIRAAYNRAKFSDERRALLCAWSDYLQRPSASVVPLRVA